MDIPCSIVLFTNAAELETCVPSALRSSYRGDVHTLENRGIISWHTLGRVMCIRACIRVHDVLVIMDVELGCEACEGSAIRVQCEDGIVRARPGRGCMNDRSLQ